MVSCQKGPTRHACACQIGPFWQDTLDISSSDICHFLECIALNKNVDAKRKAVLYEKKRIDVGDITTTSTVIDIEFENVIYTIWNIHFNNCWILFVLCLRRYDWIDHFESGFEPVNMGNKLANW